MLVIVANSQDETAKRIAERWHSYGAGVLTPADLSKSGWRHCVPSSGRSTAVVGGHRLATSEITGVVTRMPCVYEQELAQIVPADRAYVACEMTAFLHAWLSGLHCPVINRSTPNCLAGPNWRTEQWVQLAASLGIPVCGHHRKTTTGPDSAVPEESITAALSPSRIMKIPVRAARSRSGRTAARPGSRHKDILPDEPGVEVTVVGNKTFGDVDPELQGWARQIACAAGVDLLAVQFTGGEPGAKFLNASLWPTIELDDVADAIFARLGGRSSC